MSAWSEACYSRRDLWDPFDVEDEKQFEQLVNDSTILKENAVRTVRRLAHGVLKEYRGWRSFIKARREFNNLLEAKRISLPVPQVWWECVLFGRQFLLMEDMGNLPTLFDFVRKEEVDVDRLQQLGNLCRELIVAGCCHRDFHAGNILIKDKDYVLIDMDAVSFRGGPLTKKEEKSLLVNLISSLEPLSDEENLIWLKQATKSSGNELQYILHELKLKRSVAWETHFYSRARKALRDSGSWVKEKARDLQVHRRNLDSSEVHRVFNKIPVAPFIKEDIKTRLWRDQLKDLPVVVKEFREPQPLRKVVGKNKSRVSWLNSVQLEARGLPAPKPLAYKERSDGRGIIVMQDIVGSFGLDQFLDDSWEAMADEVKEVEAHALAWFFSSLKNRNTWPNDLKACNILRNGGNFLLVDHDGISFGAVISKEKILKGMRQLNLSIPVSISWKWRYVFLRSFLTNKALAKELFRALSKESKGQKALWQSRLGDKEAVL